MSRKLKIAIAILLILVLLFALIWRLWPHSLTDILSTEERAVTSLACTATLAGNHKGLPEHEIYNLNALTKDDAEFSEVLAMLQSSEYRQGFQNLLPWAIRSMDSEKDRTVLITLVWGSGADEAFQMYIDEDGIYASSQKRDGFLRYYPTDAQFFDRLIEYLQTHGTKNA